MTLAKRICALLPVDEAGKPKLRFEKGGLVADFMEAIASFLAADGADEVWLRVDVDKESTRGTNALFAPLGVLERRVFVPIVAWAPAPTPADARLLLSFGADRVVIDARLGLPDPVGHVARVVQAVGADRVTVALSVRRVPADKGVAWELVDDRGQGTGVDALVLAQRMPAVGACEIVLVHSTPAPTADVLVHDGELIESVSATLGIPVLSVGEDRDAADLATPLLMGADGVCTALFAGGTPTPAEVKEALLAYGIGLRPAGA
jgi:imidazole glycerol phosphate synthase subunit HisF